MRCQEKWYGGQCHRLESHKGRHRAWLDIFQVKWSTQRDPEKSAEPIVREPIEGKNDGPLGHSQRVLKVSVESVRVQPDIPDSWWNILSSPKDESVRVQPDHVAI